MSKRRKQLGILCIVLFAASVCLGYMLLPNGEKSKQLIGHLGFDAWKSAICFAFGASFFVLCMAVFSEFDSVRRGVLRAAMLSSLLSTIWLGPITIGYFLDWTVNGCHTFSLCCCLVLVAISDVREMLNKKDLAPKSGSYAA